MKCKIRWLGITLLGLTLLAVQAPVGADDNDSKDKNKPGFDRALAAYQLVEWGRENKRPEYLITAAGVLKDLVSPKDPHLKVEKATVEFDKDVKQESVPDAGKLKGYKEQADELLTEAEKLADGNAAVLDLIKAVRLRPVRDAMGGPQAVQRVVPGRATDSVQIAFVGGRPARIGVRLGTNQFVDMSLVGPKGGIIFKDRCIVGQANFVPPKDAVFTVRIHNPNVNPIAYRIFTN